MNGTFEVDATSMGESRLGGNLYVWILDGDGELLQYVTFHTSCSQPLGVGDQFGSFLIEGFVPEVK